MKAFLKFYADTPRGEINKRFTFKVNNLDDAVAAVKRFQGKGWNIRAAWCKWLAKDDVTWHNVQIFSIHI